MSALRVGFAVLRFFDERTGNVESLLNLMTGLRERGVEGSLLVPRATAQLEMFKGFAVHRYSQRALFDADIFAVERALVHASRELRTHFDLLQLQLPSPAFVRVAERARRASGLPVVASFESGYHTAPAVPWPAPGKTLLSLWARRLLNHRLHARLTRFAVDACVVASDYQRYELESVGCRARVHVIGNSTVCERFEARAGSVGFGSGSSPRHELLPAGKRTIGYLGHFNFIKGVTHLLAAFQRLAAQRDDLHLLVVGSGRGNESDAVRAGVRALGSRASLVERTIDVPALLPQLDVLALPYVASYGHQLFPNLVLEALASGVPLVTSDIPPVNEIVREGETGYLARAGDAASLCAALERALFGGETRVGLRERQQALCRARFDYRVVAERHHQLYKGLLP
jgi:glycosyltransferase involved in cell wall biosynthesis